MDAYRTELAMGIVVTVLGVQITKENPILECELLINGGRFEAVILPIVSTPTLTIRKKQHNLLLWVIILQKISLLHIKSYF